ncbi:hypothetical protein EIN_097680 [Entamoeba invadens IP1]|uniref:Protein kinase domain-containing protein n=1 Tax=Entamoeba invadens IP1 TaxID=370355 RepID=A0A0A1U6N6_ENTIV|nr:hypothetical protein EIN_097680 [Entamoeba invadens IP1]ELP87481.1 hypothetical protein EIN_097680 [Entamoeba invadens IP1]|eukprot:XP_004254252.1 hypothetical protein EIN_097680 [Entamoeba invadens IP1]
MKSESVYDIIGAAQVVFMVIELALCLFFLVGCVRKTILEHTHLFVYSLVFGIHVVLFFKLNDRVVNLLLGLSSTLLILGLNLQMNGIVSGLGSNNKGFKIPLVLLVSVHFLGVIAIHSILVDVDVYQISMYSLNTVCFLGEVFMEWVGMFLIRKVITTKMGIVVIIFQNVINFFVILISVQFAVLIFIPDYLPREFIILINATLRSIIIFFSTILSLTIGLVGCQGYEEFDENYEIPSNSITTDINFLLHQTPIATNKHSVIGTAIFLGREVIYKQIALGDLFDIEQISEDIMNLRMLDNPNLPVVGGICRTNLNVYVIYAYGVCPTLETCWNRKLRDYQIYKIVYGMVNALSYLFDKNIIHYHLHSQNVLVNESCDKVIVTDILPLMKHWFINKEENMYYELSQIQKESFKTECNETNMHFVVKALVRLLTKKESVTVDISEVPETSVFYNTLKLWMAPDYIMTWEKMKNDLVLLRASLLSSPSYPVAQY